MDEILFPRGKRGHGGASLPTAADEAQHRLFGDDPKPGHAEPATRNTDPQTSHDAERRAANGLTLKQLAVLAAFQQHASAGGMIDETLVAYYAGRRQWAIDTAGSRAEFADWWPEQTASGLRTRRHELTTLGYIRKSGRKGETIAGGPSIVWELTDDGRAFAVRGHLERLRMIERQTRMVRGLRKRPEDHL
jgi:hypothetical protein